MLRYGVPVVVFFILVIFLYRGLSLKPSEIPSPLIDKPAPAFTLPQVLNEQQSFTPAQMKGKVWMLNVWASWCPSCRDEHPLLVDLGRRGVVSINGLNYKDQRQDALAWLNQFGNPFENIAHDLKGDVGIDFGVYGAPETFIIDKQGVIRYKHIGPLTGEALRDKILPLIKELQG
ncbi:MAG: DsbE family thiol:disulfide interchange protein [Gammaproteobacteria bacterium]|nr:DsbE family thiol:disulfide interchange protein [Gammaproteobacteria bacterium]